MSFPIHATEYQKFFGSPKVKVFLDEYRKLCERHNLCVLGGYDRDVFFGEIQEAYWADFKPTQNCTCEECEAWWKTHREHYYPPYDDQGNKRLSKNAVDPVFSAVD